MHLPLSPDLSVYQLALDSVAPSEPLKVSPATLKSLVGAIFDVLIEEKITATLWAKLPPSEEWQAELNRYQQVGVSQTIYRCSCIGDELADELDTTDANEYSRMFPVQLAAGSQLKREYFLIVISNSFNSLIVASPLEPVAPVRRQTHSLFSVCTFEKAVIQQVLDGIRGVIAVGDTTPDELLEYLEILKDTDQQNNLDVSIQHSSLSLDEKSALTQLLVKHIQRTEKMLQPLTTAETKSISAPMSYTSAEKIDSPSPSLIGIHNTARNVFPLKDDTLYNREEFLKRVVQELRTPLTNMKTALKLLDAAQLKLSQRQRYMQLLNRECDRQNSLISGLLELAELESESNLTVMPSVQLTDMVAGVVSTYQPIAQEKGIQLGYTMPSGLPTVCCLETWLRAIVVNLLNNSLKFTSAGDQVMVRVTLQGDYVQLAVDDTGIGIAPNEISKIFDGFYRGRSTTGDNTGAGLGLTIVQQLLLRCGGSISVTSKLGEGSSFKALLPVASPTSTSINS